jgi:hypothetical protein
MVKLGDARALLREQLVGTPDIMAIFSSKLSWANRPTRQQGLMRHSRLVKTRLQGQK